MGKLIGLIGVAALAGGAVGAFIGYGLAPHLDAWIAGGRR